MTAEGIVMVKTHSRNKQPFISNFPFILQISSISIYILFRTCFSDTCKGFAIFVITATAETCTTHIGRSPFSAISHSVFIIQLHAVFAFKHQSIIRGMVKIGNSIIFVCYVAFL